MPQASVTPGNNERMNEAVASSSNPNVALTFHFEAPQLLLFALSDF